MIKALLLCSALCLGALVPAQAEDHAAVERSMRKQLQKRPADLGARFRLAQALAGQQRYAEAIDQYGRLLKARQTNVDYLFGMAQVQFWRGAPRLALPLLKKARRLAPAYEDVWRTEIQVRLAMSDPAQLQCARRVRDKARERFPRGTWTYAQLDAAPSVALVAAPPSAAPTAPASAAAPAEPAAAAEPPRLAAAPVTAATAPIEPSPAARHDRYELEAGYSSESLNHGLPGWRSSYVLAARHPAAKTALYFGLRQTQRYARSDRELHAGAALPLPAAMQLQVEAGYSDTHRVLPGRYGLVHWLYQPSQGWALDAGLRRSSFDVGPSRVAHLTIDRYAGRERFGYTLYEGGPDGNGLSPSHRLQWAHYYGDGDWFGLTLTKGRESENTGASGFITSDVSGAMLSGRHSLAPQWFLTWDAGRLRQGDLYTRTGARIGLRHAF